MALPSEAFTLFGILLAKLPKDLQLFHILGV